MADNTHETGRMIHDDDLPNASTAELDAWDSKLHTMAVSLVKALNDNANHRMKLEMDVEGLTRDLEALRSERLRRETGATSYAKMADRERAPAENRPTGPMERHDA